VGADGAAVVAAAARLAITAACGNRTVTGFGLFGRLTGAKASAADHPGQFERQYKSRIEFKVINYTELRPQDGKQIPAEDFAASGAGSDVS
jgi:hypothetical protein